MGAEQRDKVIRMLVELGVVGARWLSVLRGDPLAAIGGVSAIGQVLRTKPAREIEQFAQESLLSLLQSKEGRNDALDSLSFPDELCRQGINAQRKGKLEGEDLLALLTGRDELESFSAAIRCVRAIDPSVGDLLFRSVNESIGRTDARLDFEIPLRELRLLEERLRDIEYAHLMELSKVEPEKWWLRPLLSLLRVEATQPPVVSSPSPRGHEYRRAARGPFERRAA